MIYILGRLLILYASLDGTSVIERISLNEVLAATGGKPAACDPHYVRFERVAIDSRTIQPGELFWALAGERHDGHDFIAEAVQRGAVACVVEQGKQVANSLRAAVPPVPMVTVPDTLKALADFAGWYRTRLDALVIGVTGSVGKTTTREMIHAVLGVRYDGCRSRKNFNNHIGLPLCVLDIEPRHEFAVLEMGASHAGEIRRLAAVAAPEVGVVTRIGVAHLDGFGSPQAIVDAKGELIEALPASGFAVLNGDDPHCRSLARRARCRVIEVGLNIGNTLRATAVELDGHQLRFRVEGDSFLVRAAGRHHLTAALVALAIAREVDMSPAQIAEGLAEFEPVAGRCEVRNVGACTVIDDTYNANPSSTEAACELLSEWKSAGRRILVLGEMAELGDESADWHQKIGSTAARLGVDRLAAFGPHAADVVRGTLDRGMSSEQLAQCNDFNVLLAVLDCWTSPGDTVLVKGSRSTRMERVTEWLGTREQTKENNRPREATRACA